MRRAVIFDLDGTLIDSAPAITLALNRLRAERGLPPLGPVQIRKWISIGAPALVGRALDLPGDADNGAIAAFRRLYSEQSGDAGDLYPGIAAAIDDLHEAGCLLAIATNKPQILAEQVLQRSGMAARFATIVGGDATLHPKPDGGHLRHTLQAMGCTGSFDFVGDSRIDADAANAAGARFLWASWGYAGAEALAPARRTLRSPGELVSAILGVIA